MPLVNVLDWRTGRGWIVLAGNALNADEDNDVDLDIEAQALTKLSMGEPIAYIYAASGDADAAEQHLESLDEMGAPTGYLVDILTEDSQSVRRQIREAGMVLLADGPDVDALRAGLQGTAAASMAEAHDRGAVIFGVGAGAAVLGAHLDGTRGLAWLEDAIIMTGIEDDERMEMLRVALEDRPECYGIGIGSDPQLPSAVTARSKSGESGK